MKILFLICLLMLDEFLQYWIQHVDAVRINEMYTHERSVENLVVTRDRTPCREIYDQIFDASLVGVHFVDQ